MEKQSNILSIELKGVSMKSVIQEEYAELVRLGVIFEVRGYSLVHQAHVYPVAMAKHIGIRPKVSNSKELDAVWNRRDA